MNWYKTLLTYGYHGGKDNIEDEDLKLIPHVIEKVLLPKLTGTFDLLLFSVTRVSDQGYFQVHLQDFVWP